MKTRSTAVRISSGSPSVTIRLADFPGSAQPGVSLQVPEQGINVVQAMGDRARKAAIREEEIDHLMWRHAAGVDAAEGVVSGGRAQQ